MIFSCSREQDSFQLLGKKKLDFPSASAIEFYQDKLYVFGDDAAYLLILSPEYKVIDSIFFWTKVDGRIPKDTKHDIESAMIKMERGQPVLYGHGSMSTEIRRGTFAFQLNGRSFKDTMFFNPETSFPLVHAINLEGSCAFGDTTVFANRANLSTPLNHLVFVDAGSTIVTKPIKLPMAKIVAGISGLYYMKEKDILLFTASEEETASTTADGAIGESYLGWIGNFSAKVQAKEFVPDRYIKLSKIDKAFTKQKIESVCVEKINGKEMIVHLAADNDDGSSGFFKVKVLL